MYSQLKYHETTYIAPCITTAPSLTFTLVDSYTIIFVTEAVTSYAVPAFMAYSPAAGASRFEFFDIVFSFLIIHLQHVHNDIPVDVYTLDHF